MKEIKIGDWVYIPAINERGKVIGAYVDKEWNERGYHVRMQDGRELDVLESNCQLADYDPKTAFLTEMQSLLRMYNVSICHAINIVGNGIVHDMIEFDFGDDSILYIEPENHPLEITPDNIFDYEKD